MTILIKKNKNVYIFVILIQQYVGRGLEPSNSALSQKFVSSVVGSWTISTAKYVTLYRLLRFWGFSFTQLN